MFQILTLIKSGCCLKIADALVLLWILKSASVSIIFNDYGHHTAPAIVVAWYGLASLYVAARWANGARAAAARWLARPAQAFGGLACISMAWVVGSSLVPASLPIRWHDWLVLGLCFGCAALHAALGTSYGQVAPGHSSSSL